MSNNLRLEVLLKAVDQATRPLKSIQTASKTLSGEIRDTQKGLRDLNGQASKIDGFRKASAQLAVTSQALDKAKREAGELAVQFKNTTSPTRAQAQALEAAKRAASELQTKYNSLRTSVQRQRSELMQAGINTRTLSADERRLKTSISETTAQLNRQREALARVSAQQAKLGSVKERYKSGKELAGNMAAAGAAGVGIATAGTMAGVKLLMPGYDFAQKNSELQAVLGVDKQSPEMQALRKQARQLGDNTAASADDAASAQIIIAKGGGDAAAIQATTPVTLNMALANRRTMEETSLAPAFMLTLNSQDITSNFSDRLISLTMTDNRGFEADQLDIELDDTDGKVELPLRGAVLTLWLGWQGSALLNKGDFTVYEIEHRGAPDTLTIRARSADFRGTLNSRREESWHDTTLGELVSTIAKRNKLTASVADSLKKIPVPHIDQSQESDAVFLTRLADRNGAAVSVKAGKLLFLKAGSAMTASGKPVPQMTLTRSDGDRHQFAIADRGAYTGVTAKWLHTKDPKPQKQKVTLKRKPKEKHLRALEHPKAKPVSKKTKAKKEPEAREGEYMAGEADNVLALTTVYASKAQAMRAAQAKWDKLQRGVAEFSITLALGRADLFPETPVRVSGFKRVIDEQSWLISKVTHNLNNSGFTTGLELEVKLSDVEYSAESDDE